MNDKEFLQKLNSLKSICPGEEWKARNREILISQIFNSTIPGEEKLAVFGWPQKIIRIFSQPAWAVLLIALLVISGGVFSARAARDIKPGGTLFIARVISEKAQLAITFDKEAKNKLGLHFANEHAKDITQILVESDADSDDNKTKTDKLAQDFKKEINEVRNKLKEIDASRVKEESLPAGNAADDDVFSANATREDQGVKLYFPESSGSSQGEIQAPAGSGEPAETDNGSNGQEQEESGGQTATSSEAMIDGNEANLDEAHKILEEAEELFDQKDYSGTLDKLEKVDAIVQGVNADNEAGEVQGVEEIATTTVDEEK